MNNNTLSTEMKVCTLCHETFPAKVEYFGVDRKGRNGLSSRCKDCLKRLRESKKEVKREYDKNRLGLVGDKKRLQAREYYQKHKEQKSEYDREYREKNREKRLQQKREYYNNNKEECNRRSKEYHLNNIKKSRATRREHYQKNKDKIIAYGDKWRAENRARVNSYSHKRKARKRELPNNFTVEQWNKCLDYFNHSCAYCGSKDNLTQDHFIPLIKGGEYTINNIIPACKSCNCSKQDTDFFEWYEEMKFYSKKHEAKILKYLGYKNKIQQLALI